MADNYFAGATALKIYGETAITALVTSASAVQTAVLPAGTYMVKAGTVDAVVRVAEDASGVTQTNGLICTVGRDYFLTVPANCKIGAIAASAGTLAIIRVGS
jgi:hypothetical protein